MTTPPVMGPVFRISIALVLCAACFQTGRWYQELSEPASAHAKGDPGNEMVSATHMAKIMPVLPPLLSDVPSKEEQLPGGAGGDIITPLNVRDPSALVMGPGLQCPPSPAIVEPDPPAIETKQRKLKKGRLLELLKKADKKSDAPKSF